MLEVEMGNNVRRNETFGLTNQAFLETTDHDYRKNTKCRAGVVGILAVLKWYVDTDW